MNTDQSESVKSPGRSNLALDIGGTWTRAALVSADGELIRSERERTRDEGSADAFVDQCLRLLAGVMAGHAGRPGGVGVSATGPVDVETGSLFRPPNAGPALDGLRLRDRLSAALDLPVVVEKDTNAAALAERRYGAAQGARFFVYLTVSTGIGASVVLDGRLMRGADGTAGEIGHVVVDPRGPLCGCGRRGCLEAIASGPAIGAAGAGAAMSGSALAAKVQSLYPDPLEGQHVGAIASAGDPTAKAVMATARAALASASVDLVNVFNPEVLVLGGSVIEGNPDWVVAAANAIRDHALEPAASRVEVRSAALGDDGGLLGAALLVTE